MQGGSSHRGYSKCIRKSPVQFRMVVAYSPHVWHQQHQQQQLQQQQQQQQHGFHT